MNTNFNRLIHITLIALSLSIFADKSQAGGGGKSSGMGAPMMPAMSSTGTGTGFNRMSNATGRTITRKVYGDKTIFVVTYDAGTGKVLSYTAKLRQ